MKFSDKVLSMIYVNYILIIYKIVFGLIWFFFGYLFDNLYNI